MLLPPVQPGEILREEFLLPLGLSVGNLAARLGAPAAEIELLLITAELAQQLARRFGTSTELWTGLQASYDRKTGRPV